MPPRSVRRRELLAAGFSAAGLTVASGCLGLNLGSGDSEPMVVTAREPTGENPSDTTAVAQFQHDAANTGVADASLPATADRDWRTTLSPNLGGLVGDDERVVSVYANTAIALDAASGDELWNVQISPTRRDAVPALSPDTAYVPGTGIDALALDDGSIRWRAIEDVDVSVPPTLADGTLYVGGVTDRTHVLAVDATTGDELWRTPLDEPTDGELLVGFSGASVPAVADDTVYVGGGDDYEHAVFAFDAADGEGLWQYDVDGEVVGDPTVNDGTVYAASEHGMVYALADGDELWSVDLDVGITGSPAVTDDAIYVPADGAMVALSHDGEERWSRDATEETLAPTVTADGLLYADDDAVVARDLDGKGLWRYEPAERHVSDAVYTGRPIWPVAHGGTVYVTSDAGRVAALGSPE